MRNLAIVLGVVLTIAALAYARGVSADGEKSLEQRVGELERWKTSIEGRLKALEGAPAPEAKEPSPAAPPSGKDERKRTLITVALSNKRYQPREWAGTSLIEEAIWWDATYTGAGLAKQTRAVKGVLVMADIFGEPKFHLRVTLNDPIRPKGTMATKGVGFDYNQFRDTHVWVRQTELKDMRVWLDVESIIYSDGTTETFE